MKINDYSKSSEMLLRANNVIPSGVYGHLGPAEGCMMPVEAYPKFCTHAKGSYFYDIDGNKILDYMCGYGPNILGYCDDDVDNAAIEQLKLGNCVTNPTVKMVELAELLVDTVASADWAFFAKNGGDVTTLAMMTARAATGRKKMIFIKGYYHGVAPWTQKADSPGVLVEDVKNNLLIPFNDISALENVIAENQGDIAGLISTPYMHGNFVDNILPIPGYWQKVREICDKYGIILIIDDVRCGFRLDLGGSDRYYGFKADLICFCKAIANGYNMSALCGKDFLKSTVSSIMYTGSYWMSSVPFAAGIACINKLKKLNAPAYMRQMGLKLCDGLSKIARDNDYGLAISGEPALFYLRSTKDESLRLHQELIAEVVKRGVFMTNHHNHFINCSLQDRDIMLTLEAFNDAIKTVKKKHPKLF